MIFARTLVAFFAACVLSIGAASAQTYPSKPVTLIVPYPPGGATDAISRILQDAMARSLGQPIIIENIGGAGGMIAAQSNFDRILTKVNEEISKGVELGATSRIILPS